MILVRGKKMLFPHFGSLGVVEIITIFKLSIISRLLHAPDSFSSTVAPSHPWK